MVIFFKFLFKILVIYYIFQNRNRHLKYFLKNVIVVFYDRCSLQNKHVKLLKINNVSEVNNDVLGGGRFGDHQQGAINTEPKVGEDDVRGEEIYRLDVL